LNVLFSGKNLLKERHLLAKGEILQYGGIDQVCEHFCACSVWWLAGILAEEGEEEIFLGRAIIQSFASDYVLEREDRSTRRAICKFIYTGLCPPGGVFLSGLPPL
jgi:hypothetical protein